MIVDPDGVIWLSGHPIDGAAETIRRLRARGVRILCPHPAQPPAARR